MTPEYNRGYSTPNIQSELFPNPPPNLGGVGEQPNPAVPPHESEEERAKICRWINDILNAETRQMAFLQLRYSI